MIKYCPQCDRTYEGVDFDTCPEDGGRLFVRKRKKEDDPLLGSVLDERFRIEESLSAGGMGAVYRATQLSVQREVALKVVRPELDTEELFMERFFREARVVAELSHPNIVRLIDFGQDRDRDLLYLVMELVRGAEMGDLLSQGRLDPALALEVTYQICAGLTEPHSRGIVHRDLKPANIILVPSSDGTFQVKLLDFGIARSAELETQLTATGMICGTPSYLSPEQAQNLPVDERTDLYSLGIVLFEMLTGHLPFRAPSGLQLLFEHVQRPPPKLSRAYPEQIPEPLSRLVSDLMAKAPEDRPQRALEVRRRIQHIRHELKLSAVFLEEERGANVVADEVFSPWLLPELDLGRLDEVEQAKQTSRDDRRKTGDAVQEESEPSKDISDIATDETLSATQAEFAVLDTALETGEDGSPATFDKTLAAYDFPQSTETEELDEEGADADRSGTAADEAGAAKPATAQILQQLGSRASLTVTIVVVGAAVVLVALFVITSSSDSPDAMDGEESTPASTATAQETTADDDDVIAKKVQAPVVDPDLVQKHQVRDESSSPEATSEESHQQELVPTPVVETPDPPDAPVVVAEAEVDSTQDSAEPGSARPPTAPTPLEEYVHEGSVVIESPSQVPAVLAYHEIAGDLVIRINFDDYSHLELPNLERIRGNLVVDPNSRVTSMSLPKLERIQGGLMLMEGRHLNTIEAPKLHTVDNSVTISNSSLESVAFNALRRIGGALFLANNQNVSTVELPRLQNIAEGMKVMGNGRLQTLSLPQLEEIGAELEFFSGQIRTIRMNRLSSVGAHITFNVDNSLRTLEMGRLSTVGANSSEPINFALRNTSELEVLDLSSLRRVNGNLIIDGLARLGQLNLGSLQQVDAQLSLTNNSGVTHLDLDSLRNVEKNLHISNNTSLRSLELSRLKNVEGLQILNSPELSSCKFQGLVDAMKADGWDGNSQLTNLDDGQCSD